jgi:hypothetical protein
MWKVNRRQTPSEGKSSHCLWHCELKMKPLNLLVVPDFVSMFGVFLVFCLVLKVCVCLKYLDFLSSMILLIVLIFVYLLFTLFRFYIYTDKNESTSSMQFYCCKCSTPYLHVETFHWIILKIIYRTRDILYLIYSEGACQFKSRPFGLVWILTRPFTVNQI